jgi:putative ABC transport system permease protein
VIKLTSLGGGIGIMSAHSLPGLTLGLAGAYFVGRGMQSTLYGVGKIDLSVFGLVALVLLLAAVIACLLPAFCAASVQPMQARRAE